jgi:hypothetical protein
VVGPYIFSHFSLILFYFWLCASLMSFGYIVGVEARCNWYLHDINIFPL